MTSEEMVEGTLAELAPALLLAEGADGFGAPGTDPTEERLQAALDEEAARWIPECADEPAAASGAETPPGRGGGPGAFAAGPGRRRPRRG